ncbi:MAG: LysR family transcriptional regulator [Marivivens sp.]|nr:LysR family transcriptional regulator [Marivivens sp.]
MIEKLEMLIALAREEHFGRAAESLGLTQPTLSAGIKQLEAQLGVQLVWRGSRFGGLTPEGQRVLIWARQIVGDARTMREEMRAVRQGLSGEVRLAVIPTALTAASALSAGFAAQHPGVRFTILSRTSIEILAMLENLEADAGITYLDNEPLGRVATVPLYREDYCLVCAEGMTLAAKAQIGWDELEGLPLCLLTPDMQNRRILNQNFQAAGVSVTASVEANSTVVLAAHVATGTWVTILPDKMARFLAAGNGLNVVPMAPPERAPMVGLVALHRDPHTPVLEALIKAAGAMSEAV